MEEGNTHQSPGFDIRRMIRGDDLGRLLESTIAAHPSVVSHLEGSDEIKAEIIHGIRQQYDNDSRDDFDKMRVWYGDREGMWYGNRMYALEIKTQHKGVYVVGVKFVRKKPNIVSIDPQEKMCKDANALQAYIKRRMKEEGIWQGRLGAQPEGEISYNNLTRLKSADVTRYIREHCPTRDRHRGRIVFEYARLQALRDAREDYRRLDDFPII